MTYWTKLKVIFFSTSWKYISPAPHENAVWTIRKKVGKGTWRMPWLAEAMKDVISCDKSWGDANDLWSRNFRMGQPNILKRYYPSKMEANAGNWNILVPAGKENNNDSPSSGERTGNSPNQLCYGIIGVVGPRHRSEECEKIVLESSTIEHDSCVYEAFWTVEVSWVARSTRNSAWICRDHPVRLNTPERPIVNQYCEGKVKSTSNRGVK